MVDRLALIEARAGTVEAHPALPSYDALVGLRVGFLAGELHALSSALTIAAERRAVGKVLAAISAHFRAIQPDQRSRPDDQVLEAIDQAIAAIEVDPKPDHRRHGAVLLIGLRRSLFPQARLIGDQR